MKNIFGIAFFLLFTVTAAQAQYKTFPKGKLGGDIIGNGEVRFEVITNGSVASFYPIDKDGNLITKKTPEQMEINVLYLAEQTSHIYNPTRDEQGRYSVTLDSEKIVYYYFIKGDFGGKTVEMKEEMALHGK